jgi:hypothetical protein
MGQTMKGIAPMKSSKIAKGSAMSAALERVRPMLIAIGGQRLWDDTKDHWRNRLARRLDMNARRVRAILSNNEKVSLTADEFINIEARFRALDERLQDDLRALSAEDRDAPSGQVRAGRKANQGVGRQGPGGSQTRLQADRR